MVHRISSLNRSNLASYSPAELAAFSMLIYVATQPTYQHIKKSWFLAGCASVIFFLTMILLK